MPHKLSFEIEDEKGAKASSLLYVPTGLTMAQYETFAQDVVDEIVQIALGVVRGAKICLRVPISSIDQTGKPAANSDVEEIGEYIFQSSSGFKSQFNLPGYDESDTLPASDAIEQGAASPASLISAFITGVTLADTVTVVGAVDAGGDDLVTLVSARERYRNSGKKRR